MLKHTIEISEEAYRKLEIMKSVIGFENISQAVEMLTEQVRVPSPEAWEKGKTMIGIGKTIHMSASEPQRDYLIEGYYNLPYFPKKLLEDKIEKLENNELEEWEIDELYEEVCKQYDATLESIQEL